MARNPFQWFPFYATDWLSDERVRMLSLTAKGAYIDLLGNQWVEGSIPDDDLRLSRLLGISLKEWMEISQEVRQFFVDNSGGRLENKRLAQEREARLRQHRRLSTSGKAGARVRHNKQHYNGVGGPATATPPARLKPGPSKRESESEIHILSSNVGGSQHLTGQATADRSPDEPKAKGRTHRNTPTDIDRIVDYSTEVLNKLEGVTEKYAERQDRGTLLRIAQHVPYSIAHIALEETQDATQRHREGKAPPVASVGRFYTSRVNHWCAHFGVQSPFATTEEAHASR